MRHHTDPIWTGLDFHLSRTQHRELFYVAALHEGVGRGEEAFIWTASMGRFMERWHLAMPDQGELVVRMIESGPIFYPGHDDLAPTDKLVLWLLEQEKLTQQSIPAHLDRRAWLITECYSIGSIKSHSLSWLEMRRRKGVAVKRHTLRSDVNRLVRKSCERLLELGKIEPQNE